MSPRSTSGSTMSATSCPAWVTRATDNSAPARHTRSLRTRPAPRCARRRQFRHDVTEGLHLLNRHPTVHPARASVLVVDDDPVIVRTLVDTLEDADYRVWPALNG